jgi:transcriptional regulator with XRE-family HTH domain
LRHVTEYIEAHLDEDLTLDELAGRTGISKPYLSLIETGRLALIHGASQAKKLGKILLQQLGRQAGASNPKAAQEITGAINKEKQIDQAVGVTTTLGALKNNAASVGIAADSAPRGSWAQMPGGFYVRYLPESYSKTKLQVIVPEAAMEHVDPKAPLTFDPTQYLAVHVGTPAQRLGITLRPVGAR